MKDKILSILFKRFRVPQMGYQIPPSGRPLDKFFHISKERRIILYILALVCFASFMFFLEKVGDKYFVSLPAYGGTLDEGIIAAPRFINPVLAVSESDKDLTALVYSGLLRVEGNDYIPDLAESYTVSPDGKTYSFKLKENLTWHDGELLTSEDVAYTISLIQSAALKSPLLDNWRGVTVQTKSARELDIILPESYAPFIKNLTVGILPRHVWKNVPIEEMVYDRHNLEAVGSGPYQIKEIERAENGVPTDIKLEAFRKFALGRPYIDKIHFHIYATEDDVVTALGDDDIESASGITAERVVNKGIEEENIQTITLPRIFSVFLNQTEAPVLSLPEIRRVLDQTTDREKIINTILSGYGEPAYGPLPSSFLTLPAQATSIIAQAKTILEQAGWVLSPTGIYEKKTARGTTRFQFALTTSNSPELVAIANQLKNTWERIGARIDVTILEQSDLTQNVIRTRKFDALLYGISVGHYPDPFFFWHSRSRVEPGLNITLYSNREVDTLTERIRTTATGTQELYKSLSDKITADRPALFLYSPKLIYIVPAHLQGITLDGASASSERFVNIYEWYLYEDRVWNLFNP